MSSASKMVEPKTNLERELMARYHKKQGHAVRSFESLGRFSKVSSGKSMSPAHLINLKIKTKSNDHYLQGVNTPSYRDNMSVAPMHRKQIQMFDGFESQTVSTRNIARKNRQHHSSRGPSSA